MSSVERKLKIGARVRKSRQKEAAGAADAGLMQIEWSEARGVEVGGSRSGRSGVAAGAPMRRSELMAESEHRQEQEERCLG